MNDPSLESRVTALEQQVREMEGTLTTLLRCLAVDPQGKVIYVWYQPAPIVPLREMLMGPLNHKPVNANANDNETNRASN